jgi:hypothetical protein
MQIMLRISGGPKITAAYDKWSNISTSFYKLHRPELIKTFCYVMFSLLGTADGGTVVKVLCYKSEGRWFDSRWCH